MNFRLPFIKSRIANPRLLSGCPRLFGSGRGAVNAGGDDSTGKSSGLVGASSLPERFMEITIKSVRRLSTLGNSRQSVYVSQCTEPLQA